jgi:hypothetical protein
MARRSVTINLVNNTQYYLVHYWEAVCHGSWGPVNGTPKPDSAAPNASMPEVIWPNSTTSFSSADSEGSVGVGTEAWVKYSVLCTPPQGGADLLFIHWYNPYNWGLYAPPNNNPIEAACVIASEGTFGAPYANLPNGEPCQQQPSPWPQGSTGSVTPGGLTGTFGVLAETTISQSGVVVCDLVPVSSTGSGFPQAPGWGTSEPGQVFDIAFGWPVFAEMALVDLETDVNFVFTFVLRDLGSVAQSVNQIYNAKSGLRALTVQNHQTSLRKLLAL